MQFRVFSGFLVFIGSYLPLAIILAVQDIKKEWWSQPICKIGEMRILNCEWNPFSHIEIALSFIFLSTLSMILVYSIFKKINYVFSIEILSCKPVPNDIINYVFPYVVSFMGMSYEQPDKLLGFLVFLLWMFAITYKSGQIMMNPLLLMFGWKIYDAKIKINTTEKEVRVLKVGQLEVGPQKAQTIQDFYITKD